MSTEKLSVRAALERLLARVADMNDEWYDDGDGHFDGMQSVELVRDLESARTALAAAEPELVDVLRKIDQKTEHLNYIPELAPHAAIIQGLCRTVLAPESRVARTPGEIKARIAEIESDDRMSKTATVRENAPLALIQVEGESAVEALRWALGECERCAGSFRTALAAARPKTGSSQVDKGSEPKERA